MAKIADGVLKVWHNGDTVTAEDYYQEREMLRVGLNDVDNTASTARADLDTLTDTVNDMQRDKVGYTELGTTTAGSAGSQIVGSPTITGLAGTNVYDQLSSAAGSLLDRYTKAQIDSPTRDHKGTWQGKNPSDFIVISVAGSSSTLNLGAGASADVQCLFNGKFTSSPYLTYSVYNTDVDQAYTIAHSIVAINKDQATIRVKNKGASLTYVLLHWRATDK